MRRRVDWPLMIFSNAFALVGFSVAISLILIMSPLLWPFHPWTAMFCSSAGAIVVLPSYQSHRQRFLRRRVYKLLERRLIRTGLQQDAFKHLCGGPCLRFQHQLLFMRYGKYHDYGTVMRSLQKNEFVFLSHPDELIEDELNFGNSVEAVHDVGMSLDFRGHSRTPKEME